MKTKTYNFLMLLIVVVLAMSSSVALAADRNSKVSVLGVGSHSCSKFLKEYSRDAVSFFLDNFDAYSIASPEHLEGAVSSLVYLSWIQGFITLGNVYKNTEKSISDIADMDGIMRITVDYCKKNSLDDLADATSYTLEKLLGKSDRR